MSKENTQRVLEGFADQCLEASKMGLDLRISKNINCLAVLGMGGSSLPGEIIKNVVDLPFPLVIIRDYTLPAYVNQSSQAFAISYSGNTEETISAYKEALDKKVPLIGISSGGKLEELCKTDGVPHIKVKSGIQPRDSVGYQTIPALNILHNSGLYPDIKSDLEETVEILEKDYTSQAKEIAKNLVDRTPVIYSSPQLAAAARIWKISFNENSKVAAYYNEFPELNHNEIVGICMTPKGVGSSVPKGNFVYVFISDIDDHTRIQKRMEITRRMLEQKGMTVIEVKLKGKSRLAKIFEALIIGKWTSYFLALEYGVDPEKVQVIEDLKRELDS